MKELLIVKIVAIVIGLLVLVAYSKLVDTSKTEVMNDVSYNLYIVGDSIVVVDPINGSTILKESLDEHSTLTNAILKDNK